MKKRMLLILLLLIPLVHAEDVLSARKASLDYKASDFIIQMNTVLNFSNQKNIDAADLSAIKTSFEAKLNEALAVNTKDDLKTKEKEMKTLANDFKAKTKEKFKDYLTELKSFVKNKANGIIAEKKKKADEEIRKIVLVEFDKRIADLKIKQDSKINVLLLQKFEKEKLKLNSTEFNEKAVGVGDVSGITSGAWSGTKDFLISLTNFMIEKAKGLDEK